MSDYRDLYNLIRRVIVYETQYLRHYNGKVTDTNDPTGKGRVKVIIFDLGQERDSQGMWCSSRFLNSLLVPKPGDWLDIGFVNGDRDRPVYYGKANDIADQNPENFDGKIRNQVIFESPLNRQNIRYNEKTNLLQIGAGNEEFVLGTQLQSFLSNLVSVELNTHTHSGVTVGPGVTGPPVIPMTAPSGLLSTKIKGE